MPALVVLTLAIAVDTATDSDVDGTAQDSASSPAGQNDQSGSSLLDPDAQQDQGAQQDEGAQQDQGTQFDPPVQERGPSEPSPDVPSAELPEGGDYTEAGEGTFEVLDGSSDPVGDGDELLTYTIEVEDGIDAASYGGDEAYAATVEGILADPRSWIGAGEVSFERVDGEDAQPDFRVSLTTSETSKDAGMCGGVIDFEASCYRGDIDRVVLNLARWVRGAHAFESDLGMYRQYLVNHEVGHVLGLGHGPCGEDGALAPVMMQQSFGVANDEISELYEGIPVEQDLVPADGKECRPNSWPALDGGTD